MMTTFQLGEICRDEKIVPGMLDPLDKEELIKVILRFRGADEHFLIRQPDPNGEQRLIEVLGRTKFQEKTDLYISCHSKITVYENLAMGFYDGLTVPYDRRIAGTNALVVGGDGKLCAVLNVEAKGDDTSCLYLNRSAGMPLRESAVKRYNLYCMEHHYSELLYRLYMGDETHIPEHFPVYRTALLDFEVRQPLPLTMPLAMDFGTTNTTAGVYLDSVYFEEAGLSGQRTGLKENSVNYLKFYDVADGWQETVLFPSVVSVLAVGAGENKLLFGYEAEQLAESSYVDEGFCVFYDIKRWIGDYEKVEEITDREGHRGFLKRKDILKEYLNYVIKEAANQFKCRIKAVHISCPVKQKAQFKQLFREILPDYRIGGEAMIDEGVSVLYNTISGMIGDHKIEYGQEYKALIIDCGGGTTDLCSCSFKVWDQRIAYKIEIETAYENGNTDFGGNNLTFRIMQILKIAIARMLGANELLSLEALLAKFDMDVYRYVDEAGATDLYWQLEDEYRKAEAFLPTRFREYEEQSRADYFMVKNNFYFLFGLAETLKKVFYNHVGTQRVALASAPVRENAVTWLKADKWKLSLCRAGKLKTIKEFPVIYLQFYEIELLLKADIYNIIREFMEEMYEEGKVEEYSLIKLTGQSCKIDTFRDALKEFVPGRTIQFKRRSGNQTNNNELKMTCVDGALRYLRDRKYGFADVKISSQEPALPYRITAYTHSGKEVILIHRLKRGYGSGMISRNMEELTLKLFLKDSEGRERYQYTCYCNIANFRPVKYEAIKAQYGDHIRQDDTDDIVEREVKFFVWSRTEDWAFAVVPVCRQNEELYLGKEEVFSFENDNWVRNFFDGMK